MKSSITRINTKNGSAYKNFPCNNLTFAYFGVKSRQPKSSRSHKHLASISQYQLYESNIKSYFLTFGHWYSLVNSLNYDFVILSALKPDIKKKMKRGVNLFASGVSLNN